jgi:glycosyl transferase family 25
LVRNIGDAVGATAYLLKPEVAQVLIESSTDIYEPVDHFLEHHQKHGLDFLAVRPYPVDITRAKSTIDDRPERTPVKGYAKLVRSISRILDRRFSPTPWFPKH